MKIAYRKNQRKFIEVMQDRNRSLYGGGKIMVGIFLFVRKPRKEFFLCLAYNMVE